ncbi:suppressor of cytokine signaling 2 isoform X1 [Pezoporus flaviventris]|uniref:suppressor of cytokine signaling 2 isoform X1 n=1 Tax=Pezoporus flaviventris TaxID=889875 RepID=UPI002AAF9E6F|nr:suppressor of cytokine signaling 2 isoform X1 [Pezoporus flaviventris]
MPSPRNQRRTDRPRRGEGGSGGCCFPRSTILLLQQTVCLSTASTLLLSGGCCAPRCRRQRQQPEHPTSRRRQRRPQPCPAEPGRRPGRGPGPCTRRGVEHRGGGGEAESFPCRQPPTCVRAGPRPPPPPFMTLRSAESLESTEGSRAHWGHPGTAAPVAEEFCEAAQLAAAMEELRRAGWYWGNMTVAEAKERLQDAPEGTFLVRDSSHSEYLLTISVKTSAGPTNLRIEYQDGKFRLDSITCVRSRLKQFNSVVHLIEYYVLMCKNRTETPSNGTVHLYLNKPLYTSTPSLQHRCRITINKCTNQIWELPLPTRLKEYLKEYQYQV